MAQTLNTTHTRSIEEIVTEFVTVTDTGRLRYNQARLAYEFVGSTEGTEATELRNTFRVKANEALQRKHEAILSEPAVTNLVNTWKYMLRANVDLSPENAEIEEIAKAAFNFAGQTFREKERNYVIPAIEAISNGMDPVKAFRSATTDLQKDKKADKEQKDAQRAQRQKEKDEELTFDSIIAVLGLVNPANVARLSDTEKSSVRDALKAALKVIA